MNPELDNMPYDQWQAERQAHWDNMNRFGANVSIADSRVSDDYYNNLGSYITQRQEEAIPVAGQGSMQFLRAASGASRLVGRYFPPASFVTFFIDTVITVAEQEGY